MVSTTPGPDHLQPTPARRRSTTSTREFAFANQVMTKKPAGAIVAVAHKRCGHDRARRGCWTRSTTLGFEYAKLGGISICVDDMKIPESKHKIIGEAQQERRPRSSSTTSRGDHQRGALLEVINIWSHATEAVAKDMMDELKNDQEGLNPIYIMAHSGARGNMAQIRQLAGMRGLMQKPTKKITGGVGEIIESPIMSNFREGLTVLEYFISTHGARKGLADTALKTSDAGYLTRRLVRRRPGPDHHRGGLRHRSTASRSSRSRRSPPTGERILEPLRDRIVGRVAVDGRQEPDHEQDHRQAQRSSSTRRRRGDRERRLREGARSARC